MQDIYNYILLNKEERQQHLKLCDNCIEQGDTDSTQLKPLLAFVLNTTIPSGMSIHCCHACNNAKCRNPYHLYWGTALENRMDSIISDRNPKSIWQKTVEKYGLEEARKVWKAKTCYGLRRSKRVLEAQRKAETRAQEALTDARKIAERNSQFGTCWIRKNGKEVKIEKNKLAIFLSEGWELGRTTKLFNGHNQKY